MEMSFASQAKTETGWMFQVRTAASHSTAASCRYSAGLHKLWQPGSLAARKWRENEEMRRKWRENEEMERD